MANLEGMPIGSLPEATSIQDEDEVVVYRPSTGKAYQANTDLIDSSLPSDAMCYRGQLNASRDLNEVFTTGIYYTTSSSLPDNVPISQAGIVLVFYSGTGTSLQIYVRYNDSGQDIYYRAYHSASSSSWRAWRQIMTTEI